jgi:cell division septation protein DedD
MKNLELQNWEKVLIAFAMMLFLASLAAYVTEFPLRNYIFGLEPEQAHEEIGKVGTSTGPLKREMLGQADFKVIEQGAALFVRDTIVTGDSSGATIHLQDGSSIELGPRTMVKLENEGRTSLLGVTRTTRIDVVTGQVTGKASPNASSKKNQVVIRTRTQEIDVAADGAPKVVKVSAEKPFIPPPHPVEQEAEAGLLENLVKRFMGGETKPQLISTDIEQPKEQPKPAPVAKPSPSPSPSPTPTPTPTPTPVASPTPSPTPSPSAKPRPRPTPKPSPSSSAQPQAAKWTVSIVSPSQNTKFKLDKGTNSAEKIVQLSWKVSLKSQTGKKLPKGAAPVSLKLVHLDENGKSKKVVLEKSVTTAFEKTDLVNVPLTQPGNYEFQVSSSDNSSSKVHFSLDNVFQGIELLQPETIGFNKNENVSNRGQRVAKVRLSWKPFPSAKAYKLKLYDRSTGTEKIQELNLNDSAYTVARQSAAQEEMFYEVSTTLPNGFTIHSIKEKFIFDFPPPDPTTPPSKSKITQQDMEAWEGGVLLTWQKTGVSEGYVIEVAQDPGFKKVLIKRSQKDNFFLVRPIKGITHYWWRVSAYARQLTSRPSQVFEFTTLGTGAAKTSTEAGQNQIQEQKPGEQEI